MCPSNTFLKYVGKGEVNVEEMRHVGHVVDDLAAVRLLDQGSESRLHFAPFRGVRALDPGNGRTSSQLLRVPSAGRARRTTARSAPGRARSGCAPRAEHAGRTGSRHTGWHPAPLPVGGRVGVRALFDRAPGPGRRPFAGEYASRTCSVAGIESGEHHQFEGERLGRGRAESHGMWAVESQAMPVAAERGLAGVPWSMVRTPSGSFIRVLRCRGIPPDPGTCRFPVAMTGGERRGARSGE